MLKVIDRAGRRCEVKQIVDLPGIEGLADILLQKFKSRFATEVCEVFHASGQQVVGTHYGVFLGQHGIA